MFIKTLLRRSARLSRRKPLSPYIKPMLKSKMLVGLLVVVLSWLNASAQTSSPVSAVNSFYRYDRSHSQVFNRRNVAARKAWFSPELYSLFQNELKREAAYLRKNPTDKPYFGDGLPFQPYDETCKAGRRVLHKSLKIEPAFQKGTRAAVTAAFAFPKPCAEPDTTTYTIGLIRIKGNWVIDDVNYGEDRTLKQDLKRKEY